jgi:hypothetical protein
MLKLLMAIIIVGCWTLVIQERNVSLWTDTDKESDATLEAYSYAQSFSNIDRRLLFVHIPKTAGSTMEMDVALGQDKHLTWGKCMFLDGIRGCTWRRDAKFRFGRPLRTLPPYWHVPVHYFPLYNYNPYDADTFAVIRHPVDRAISEYHYVCSRGKRRQRGKELCKNMTNFILTGLDPENAKNFVFPRADYHWISQRDFIVGPFETRTVDHILQMEDMSPHFEQLVTAFGLPHLHWPVHRNNAGPSLNAAPSLNSTKAAVLPGNLSTDICKYPYVVDDLALWKNSTPGRDLFSKTKYGHLCKG